MYDVVVVGAGPIGSRVAELIAKKGFKVAIIDKKKEVGEPVQCAGLVSYRLKALIPDLPRNVIRNMVTSARFYSSQKMLELKSSHPYYVIDRKRFDRYLLSRAKKAKAHVGLDVLYRDHSSSKTVVESKIKDTPFKHQEHFETLMVETSKGQMETKLLVGADGPMSTVAVRANLKRPSNMMQGVQMTIEAKDSFDPDSVELFFSKNISPDFFGWVVPLSAHEARIGVAAKKEPIVNLKNLVEKRTGGEVSASSIRPDVAGKINFGLMERTSTDQVLIVGDAAAQVKPFSGGGIIYGLIGAGYAANAIIKALRTNDFSSEFFKREYDEQWKSHLTIPIRKGMLYKNAFKGTDGQVSDFRANTILGLGSYTKGILESFDGDLL